MNSGIDIDTEAQKWFRSEVWFKRMASSIGLSTGFSAVLYFSITGILAVPFFSSWNPLQWILAGLVTVFSLKSFLLGLLSLFLFGATCCIYPKIITVYPRSIKDAVTQKISPMHFVWDVGLNFAFLVVSLVTSYYILEASGSQYNIPTMRTGSEGQEVASSGHLLIIWSIFVSNLWSTFDYFSSSAYMIRFTGIMRPLIGAFKSDLPFVTKDCLKRTAGVIKISLITFPLGVKLIGSVLAPDTDLPSIRDVCWSLVDIKMIFALFLLVFRTQLIIVMTRKFFQWMAYWPVNFPIPPPHHNTSFMDKMTETPYLHVALESRYDIMLKYYGFWDLNQLSQYSMSRRAQLFAVSTPGGHPRNWNAIFKVCLNQLERLKEDIEKQNGRLCGSVDVGFARQNQVSKPERESLLQPKQIGILEKSQPNGGNQAKHSRIQQNGRVNPWESGHFPRSGTHNRSEQQNKQNIQSSAIVKFFAKVRVLGRKDLNSQSGKAQTAVVVFQDSQLHIWTVEALSFLVYFSYNEDKLGIVQKDLPAAFGLILDLQSAVERFCRLSGMHHQFFPGISGSSSKYLESLVIGLRQTLHSAVYRIHDRFGSHLDSISLTNNQRIWLNAQHF